MSLDDYRTIYPEGFTRITSESTRQDRLQVPFGVLPAARIGPSPSGNGFLVHVEGMDNNGVHTSIGVTACFKAAAEFLAAGIAMQAEENRLKDEARKDMLEALHDSGLFGPGADMSTTATKLLAVGVRAPARKGGAQ